jgi:hypothetical protein
MFTKLRMGDHQNAIRTSVRRMLRDGCGLSQRDAQEWAEAAENCVDLMVITASCILMMTPNPYGRVVRVPMMSLVQDRIRRGVMYNFPTVLSGLILNKLAPRPRL